MNEDDYRDKQLDKHLREEEDRELVSSCCGESMYEDLEGNDICFNCQEECSTTSHGEYITDEYETAMCDKADADRDDKLSVCDS